MIEEEKAPGEDLEEGEEEEPLLFEEWKRRLYQFVYNQPTVILSILEITYDLLIERGIMTQEEMEAIMKEGLRKWRDEIGAF